MSTNETKPDILATFDEVRRGIEIKDSIIKALFKAIFTILRTVFFPVMAVALVLAFEGHLLSIVLGFIASYAALVFVAFKHAQKDLK